MREPANDGVTKGVIGGIAAIAVGIVAVLARVGDDLGRVAGTGARLADDVAVGGAFDDLGRAGRLGEAGALGEAARLGDDVMPGISPGSTVADDAGHLLDLVTTGVDVAGMAAEDEDPVATGLAGLDDDARTGPPVLAYGHPDPGPGPELVLVMPGRSPEGVLAECVAERRWCVVEAFGGEQRTAIVARFEALAAWWERDRPTDAQWVARMGHEIPAGVSAAWMEPGERWVIGHPR